MRHSSLHPGRVVSVGVDARGLYTTGIGRYTREVLVGMLADPRFAAVTLLGDPDELHTFAAEQDAAGRVRVEPFRASWFSRRTQSAWLSLWARGRTRADVWFFPSGDVPLVAHPRRSVATIHDLIVLKAPREMSDVKGRTASRVMLYGATRRAHRVITVSAATRADVVERVPGAARKTTVVPQGVASDFSPLAADEALLPRVAAERPFLLCVGSRYPHKNQVRAVEALARVRSGCPALRLVFAGGGGGPTWDQTWARAGELGVADALTDLGSVTDVELRHLYAACEALVFPSLLEGFGLPVLEAMACGAPVITSNRSSLPEVAGDAAAVVDPDDPEAIAQAVLRLAGEPGLRAAMRERGLARAAQFPWSATAARTADILFAAAAGDVRRSRV